MIEPVNIPDECNKLAIARTFLRFEQYFFFKFFLPSGAVVETSIAARNREQLEAVKEQLSGWRLVEETDYLRVYER